ncbi:MAG: glycosyltransferase family 2 protein [Propionicimonas sp.]|uniref:glycosyltransferase family 2 protein n=1 Tax=Propionicimonas sp. TaxID=1955623 RepID=UPI003D14D9E8
MSELPLVSVVIATRNRPEMLRTAIAAVVAQSYEGPIECLIVFDQTDVDQSLNSEEPLRSVRVMPNTRTPGLAGARNTGILQAHGEYVAFCDDDDYWRPTKIAKQLAGIGSALTSATGIEIDYGGHQTERVPTRSTFTLENLVRKRLMEAHPSSVLMRRDAILDKIGLVDEELPGSFGEDYDYIIRALQAGQIAIVEEPLVVVRWGQSMFSRDWDTIIAAIDYMLDKHEVFHRDPKALARLYGQRSFAKAARGDTQDALRDVRKTLRLSPMEKRAYVTLLVTTRLISAPKVLDIAHKRGHGI